MIFFLKKKTFYCFFKKKSLFYCSKKKEGKTLKMTHRCAPRSTANYVQRQNGKHDCHFLTQTCHKQHLFSCQIFYGNGTRSLYHAPFEARGQRAMRIFLREGFLVLYDRLEPLIVSKINEELDFLVNTLLRNRCLTVMSTDFKQSVTFYLDHHALFDMIVPN